MVNEKYYGYGTAPSIIRELFAYGLEQAKKLGRDKVYDYSLGNPSIPAPKKVNETIKKLVDEESSILLHGYSMAPGFESTREAIAANLRKSFNTNAQAISSSSLHTSLNTTFSSKPAAAKSEESILTFLISRSTWKLSRRP